MPIYYVSELDRRDEAINRLIETVSEHDKIVREHDKTVREHDKIMQEVIKIMRSQKNAIQMTYETVKEINIHVRNLQARGIGRVVRNIQPVTTIDEYHEMQTSLRKRNIPELYVSFNLKFTPLSGKYYRQILCIFFCMFKSLIF